MAEKKAEWGAERAAEWAAAGARAAARAGRGAGLAMLGAINARPGTATSSAKATAARLGAMLDAPCAAAEAGTAASTPGLRASTPHSATPGSRARAGRAPPMAPAAFAVKLESGVATGEVGFTNKGDVGLVTTVYDKAFDKEMGQAVQLSFQLLGWSDAQGVAVVGALGAFLIAVLIAFAKAIVLVAAHGNRNRSDGKAKLTCILNRRINITRGSICDRRRASRRARRRSGNPRSSTRRASRRRARPSTPPTAPTVSYTHLTLPTKA